MNVEGMAAEVMEEFSYKLKNGPTGMKYGKFVIKDIGFGGVNLVSNYEPDIGSDFRINIERYGRSLKLSIKVIYSNIMKFSTNNEGIFDPGIIYTIGCKIKQVNSKQRECIKHLIKNQKGN